MGMSKSIQEATQITVKGYHGKTDLTFTVWNVLEAGPRYTTLEGQRHKLDGTIRKADLGKLHTITVSTDLITIIG